MAYKIRAIIEVAGTPQNYVDKVMFNIVENLKKELQTKVIETQIAEARPSKDSIFAGFIETELQIDTFEKMIYLLVNYMPSSIELLDVTEIKMKADEFRNAMNDLLSTIHKTQFMVSNLQAENMMLKQEKEKKNSKQIQS
jgi:hypothetical protein